MTDIVNMLQNEINLIEIASKGKRETAEEISESKAEEDKEQGPSSKELTPESSKEEKQSESDEDGTLLVFKYLL